jgi:multiple sugar transport system ATP-binding protein
MAALSLRQLRKSYGSTDVIRGIDLEIHDGEFLVLVGPSGCGKSTTLRMIAGLEEISGGDLFIGEQRVNDVRPADRGAAMVFQSYALYPHMTVAQNMGFALKMAGVAAAARTEQVARTAAALRITELLERFPKDLSGGQRQRVAIGRAIVRQPQVFLFDEPLSNLDASLRVSMRIELTRLHKELGTTMVYVTHDQVEAMTMGTRIAVFNQGRIEQVGAPMDLYNAPTNLFVAGFLGSPSINLLPHPTAGSSEPHHSLWQALMRGRSPAAAQATTLALRPEHLRVLPAGAGVPATLVLAEHLGDTSILHLRIAGLDGLWQAKVGAGQHSLVADQAVGLQVDAAATLAFDAAGQRLP